MSKEERRARQLPLSVIDVVHKPGRSRQFAVGRPKSVSNRIPGYMVRKAMMERSYISVFLERPLPKLPGMTIICVLQAWCILDDLINRLRDEREEPLLVSFSKS